LGKSEEIYINQEFCWKTVLFPNSDRIYRRKCTWLQCGAQKHMQGFW
jgi:hypothetical protein